MILTHSPQALPGSCFKCGSANRESFVDLEFSFDMFGAVIFCDLCIIEMAQLLGMLSKEQTVQLNAEMEVLRADLYEAQVTNIGLEKAVSGLTTARRHSQPYVDPADSIIHQSVSGPTESVSEGTGTLEHEGNGTPESTPESQLDGVQSTPERSSEFSLRGI